MLGLWLARRSGKLARRCCASSGRWMGRRQALVEGFGTLRPNCERQIVADLCDPNAIPATAPPPRWCGIPDALILDSLATIQVETRPSAIMSESCGWRLTMFASFPKAWRFWATTTKKHPWRVAHHLPASVTRSATSPLPPLQMYSSRCSSKDKITAYSDEARKDSAFNLEAVVWRTIAHCETPQPTPTRPLCGCRRPSHVSSHRVRSARCSFKSGCVSCADKINPLKLSRNTEKVENSNSNKTEQKVTQLPKILIRQSSCQIRQSPVPRSSPPQVWRLWVECGTMQSEALFRPLLPTSWRRFGNLAGTAITSSRTGWISHARHGRIVS